LFCPSERFGFLALVLFMRRSALFLFLFLSLLMLSRAGGRPTLPKRPVALELGDLAARRCDDTVREVPPVSGPLQDLLWDGPIILSVTLFRREYVQYRYRTPLGE